MASERGQALFAELTDDLRARPDITEGTMLHSPALRVNGIAFAFAGHGDRLIVKVPRERVDALVTSGEGEPLTMGTRTMKEWVALAYPGDETGTRWRELIEEALAFVETLTP